MYGFMRGRLEDKWTDKEFADSVSQVSSRAVFREMSVPEDPNGCGWQYDGQVVRRHAATLMHLTEALAIDAHAGGAPSSSPPPPAALGGYALRLARLWECIARLDGPSLGGHSLLNAACMYDLAGYQANSTCLSRRFDRERSRQALDLSHVTNTFLQRQFVRLRRECLPLCKEPDYEEVQDMPHALGMAVAARSLSSLGGYFLSGSTELLDTAEKGLGVADRLFAEAGLYRESSLVHSVRSMAGPMASRSTWSVLGDMTRSRPAWRRYAMLLARGPGPGAVAESRSVSELWPSQRTAIEGGLLLSNRSLAVRIPTSSGKTRIAEMAMLDALTSGPGGAKCVYVAPYRALVSEVAASLSEIFPDLGFTVSGLDGSYDDDPFDEYAASGSDILVMTPEKLDLATRAHPEWLGRARLFIFDEGHVVGIGCRGLRMELLMTRLGRRHPDSRVILLSAMISDESIGELAQWLCDGRRNAVTSEWSPTAQRRARFEWPAPGGAGGLLVFDECEDDPLSGHRMDGALRRTTYEYRSEATGRTSRKRFPSPDKGETAAELAFKYSHMGPVLVYATTKRSAMSVAKKLDRRIGLARATGGDVPAHFSPSAADEARSLGVAREWLGDDHEVSRLLARGIAVHHADVPDALKRSIETDVRDGAYRVIVATNTLSQGVNTPVRTVVVHSCRRYDERADMAVPIPASEYWNLAGRAGRAGRETEGLVIHIVASGTDRRDYEQYGRGRGREQVRSHLHSLLEDLVSKRISDADLEELVDPDVLGMLAEESEHGRCEDAVKELLSGTLADAQAGADGVDMSRVYDRFRCAARNAAGLGRDLRVYAGTGLGSQSCRSMREYIAANKREVRALIVSPPTDEDAARLVLLILDAVEGLPEMSGGHSYGGDRAALIRMWVAGESVPEVLAAVPTEDRCAAARFVERFLGHYMPWGISAFVRIAAAEFGISAGDLPPRVLHLPDMVRYGVPAPVAGWAMRLGVPTRRAAMRMAADYAGEQTVPEFAGWLAGLGDRRLAQYGRGAAAAALAASRMAPNRLIRGGYSMRRVLEMGAAVRCARNGRGPIAAARLSRGNPLEIRRDYDAAYDRNAIAVYADGSLIGHVERDVAQYLAPLIDCGAHVGARADAVNGGPGGIASVRIALHAGGNSGVG